MADTSIERIRSGGQTGVDRAALDAAVASGTPHGGWCPAGRRAEDGRIPEVYRLRETPQADYAERTRLNVRDADATLILVRSDPQGGTLLTLQTALELRKPVLLVDAGQRFPRRAIEAWLRVNGVRELNVAGPRGSAAPDIYRHARAFMDALLGG